MKNLFIIITATFCLLLQPLAGVDVPVTGSDLIGTRTNPESSGVFSTEGWSGSSPNGFTIHWNISNLNNGSYRYTYGLTNANPAASLSINPVTGTPSLSNNPLSKGLSHVIFQVSSNFTGDNINSVTGATLNPSDIKTYNPSDPGNSNPGLPGSFFGIKFEDPTSETLPLIQFDSDRIPI